MVNEQEALSKLKPLLNRFSDFFTFTVLRDCLIEVLRTSAAREIKRRLLAQYDLLTQTEKGEFGPAIQGKDPSALELFRGAFETQLDRELQNIVVSGDTLEINLMAHDLLGFGLSRQENAPDTPRSNSPETVDFLGYYVEGMVDEFAFISYDQYKKNPRRKAPRSLGRFGGGFLISKKRYELEQWEKVTGYSFSEVRHPISGQRPFKGFTRALDDLNFSPYIEEAISRAVEKFAG